MKKLSKIFAAVVATFAIAFVPSAVTFGQASSDVTQQINGGVLSTAILNASRATVASPSFAMSTASFSFDCQTVTGSLGSDSQRLYVINPSGTTSGQTWTLALAATGPWTDGSNTYAYNDPAGAGCDNGQLTVDPSAGTLTDDCTSTACTTASVSQGNSTAMSGATPVTLLSAPTNTTVYRGYLTDVELSQEIPAEKPAGNYTLPVTITATAS